MGTPNLPATAACCALIVFAPHPLGGATHAAGWFIAAAACVALGAVLANAREVERKRFLVPAGWAALALHAFTIIQALPLPCGVVHYLSPVSFANTMRAQALAGGDGFGSCTLSYDAGATQAGLAWTTTLVCSLFAFALFVQLGGRWILLISVALSSALVALTGLLHRLGGIDSLYGVYQPIYAHPRVLGPFINENHLGAYIAIGVPLIIALGLEAEDRSRGSFCFIAASLSAGTAILTLSRGAFAMLTLELALLLCFLAVSRRRRRGARSGLLVAIIPAVGGLALGLLAVGDDLIGEFHSGDTRKVGVIWEAFKFSLETPILGIGRGAFGSAFTRVFGSTGCAEYVESLVVQWAADWGWPLAIFALAWAGWWIARSLAKMKSTEPGVEIIQVASMIALVALAFQNLLDFNIDLAGAVPAVAALFVSSVIPNRDQRTQAFVGDVLLAKPLSTDVCTAVLVPAVAGLVWCVWTGSSDVPFEELQRQVQSRSASAELLTGVKKSLSRHPADARFALLGASVATSAEIPEASAWVANALELAPGWAGPHLLQAYQDLVSGNVERAAGQLRLAAEGDPTSDGGLTCPVALVLSALKLDLLLLLPDGPAAVAASNRVAECEQVSPEAKRQFDREVSQRIPSASQPRVRLARDSSVSNAEKIRLLEPLVDQGVSSAMVYGVLAGAYDASGKPELADLCLKKGLARSDQRYLIYNVIAHRRGKAGRLEPMREAIRSMRAEAADRAATLADSYAREGALEKAFGDRRLALEAFEKAYRQTPRKEWLDQLLSIAAALGDSVKVKWARIELCREGDHASCSDSADLASGATYRAQGYAPGDQQ